MSTSDNPDNVVSIYSKDVVESYRNLIRILADTYEDDILDDIELDGEHFKCVLCHKTVKWDEAQKKYMSHSDTCPYRRAVELRDAGRV